MNGVGLVLNYLFLNSNCSLYSLITLHWFNFILNTTEVWHIYDDTDKNITTNNGSRRMPMIWRRILLSQLAVIVFFVIDICIDKSMYV